MLDYFPEFDLDRHGYRLAWDIPVGTGKTALGAAGTIGLGAVAIFDPEPLTKVAAGGGAVVSASFTAEGFTQVFGIGPAGGWNALQEAAGWYGRSVAGPEGELWARRGMGVSQFALSMAGGMAKTNIGTAKFRVGNLRAWPGIGKDALKADVRTGSAALKGLYAKWITGKKVTPGGISAIESHLRKLDALDDPANMEMLRRLKSGEIGQAELRFYQHEIIESKLIKDYGYEGARAAHLETLRLQGIKYERGYEQLLYGEELYNKYMK